MFGYGPTPGNSLEYRSKRRFGQICREYASVRRGIGETSPANLEANARKFRSLLGPCEWQMFFVGRHDEATTRSHSVSRILQGMTAVNSEGPLS